MKLNHGLHLAYCTNIHRGQTWAETLDSLQRYTLAVRDRVSPGAPYAIGLRLSEEAARELSEPAPLAAFRRWLDREGCYVFTINGFPYGRFHGTRVKEQVYAPDWTRPERLAYTNRLFDLLAELVPPGVEGSVSTVPGSFKEFITCPEQVAAMIEGLWQCVEHVARLSERTGKLLHLGLEPEPLCFLETSAETVQFIEQLRARRPGDPRLDRHLGVNYDTCHLAVEFEEPREVLRRFDAHGVRISKIHLSSALKMWPTAPAREALRAFADDTYFHQVIERGEDGALRRYRDLDV
ncbi:MAG TPA: metabolite traffic protein EboE, partial [Methylomirabilota bacterium]|nr:metabolite traffic protein EboE [Methylomirabilota bacterium]